ncbi:MAG TPA: 50S ribosomal protein L6 [Bacillota bacterium]|nr:50S ribosomal protein L6 [Bacillota bacterium]
MSRIGFNPIEIPENVEVKKEGNIVTVKGPKGELNQTVSDEITVTIDENEVVVKRHDDSNKQKALHGTTRSLISNMIEGVQKEYEKHLEIVGVGYRAQKQGKNLVINAGYSHQVEIEQPEGIEIEVPQNTEIIVKGIDKELVGTVAARIRAVRSPEPYKGKGIRYKDEYVRRKEGKTAN